jgi:hypothetical protein
VEQTSMLPGAVTEWVFHVEQVRAAPVAKTSRYVPRGTRLTLAVGTNQEILRRSMSTASTEMDLSALVATRTLRPPSEGLILCSTWNDSSLI